MRRVLLIHYHFLPVHNVAVKHLLGYARYLRACGWEPLVLTNDWKEIGEADAEWGLSWEPDLAADVALDIHRVAAGWSLPVRRARPEDAWPTRKLLTLTHVLAGNYPDRFISWARPAVAYGIDLARRHRIDAILSYCPPETNHIVGGRIAQALDIPWVPYFGDLYGYFLAPASSSAIGATMSRWNHRRWLAPAAACAAVSPYMVDYLAQTYRKPASLVLVGFEPRDFDTSNASRPGDRFVVSHVGSVYPGNQQPEIFVDGLDAFLQQHPEAAACLNVRFVGSKCDDALAALVRGRPAERVVRILPKVASTEAVAMVRHSDVLLAFTCAAFGGQQGTLSYPSKVFEALGARRPILAMPPDGDWVDALLACTRGGTAARAGAEVAAVLGGWFDEWKRTGAVAYHGIDSEIDAFTHARQAAHLAAVLDAAVEAARRRQARPDGVPGALPTSNR